MPYCKVVIACLRFVGRRTHLKPWGKECRLWAMQTITEKEAHRAKRRKSQAAGLIGFCDSVHFCAPKSAWRCLYCQLPFWCLPTSSLTPAQWFQCLLMPFGLSASRLALRPCSDRGLKTLSAMAYGFCICFSGYWLGCCFSALSGSCSSGLTMHGEALKAMFP